MEKLGRNHKALRLAATLGLAILFLLVLLWATSAATTISPFSEYIVTALNDGDVDGQWIRASTAPTTTWYVHPGGSDSDSGTLGLPFATIQYAIDRAEDGDLILVHAGVYDENLRIDGKWLTLRGGYSKSGTSWVPRDLETVVDASGADETVFFIGGGSVVHVESFTLYGGNSATVGGGFAIINSNVVINRSTVRNNAAGESGGGIYVEEQDSGTARLTLIDSELLYNDTGGDGGGLICHMANGGPVTLQGVELYGNTAQGVGGGVSVTGGRLTITNTNIVSNTAIGQGGGIHAGVAYIYGSAISSNVVTGTEGAGISAYSLYMYDSEVNDNVLRGGDHIYGGGIAVRNGRLHLQDSTVSGNRVASIGTSYGGNGLVVSGGQATILNTRVSDNRMGNSAVTLFSSSFAITNTLVVSNHGSGFSSDDAPLTGTMMNVSIADNGSDGIGLTGGGVTVTNSIIWGNGGQDFVCDGDCAIHYSDFSSGNVTGTANINADPLFVDPGKGDFHLRFGSPAIDAGTPTGAPTTDIEGILRNAIPDIGAYEWNGYLIPTFLPVVLHNH